jgi:PKHD-type hydroxylase
MQYVLTPHSPPSPPWAWWDNVFSEQELDWLQRKAKEACIDGRVGTGNDGGPIVNTDIRRASLNWLDNIEDNNWLFKRLGSLISKTNAENFRFDLSGFSEPVQLANYDQSVHGTYGWHADFGSQVSRKLSLSLQLTDPSEYEGGHLEVFTGVKPERMKKKRGYVVIFPSFTLHQVTPVTEGSRQSLVIWASGPSFR